MNGPTTERGARGAGPSEETRRERAEARPRPQTTNPLRRLAGDLTAELRASSYPPGEVSFDLRRSMRMNRDPLSVLMPLYERHGPVFTIRVLHALEVFMIGPEANHLMTVSARDSFSWRDGSMRELIPLVGDGLLTTDGGYHDRMREILMPAFHGPRVLEAMEVVAAETERSLPALQGEKGLDAYVWARRLAIRIAMRALLGLDPDDNGAGRAAAHHFERALRYYGVDYHLRLLRGPGSPWRRTLESKRALDEIVLGEIARRRGGHPEGHDVLALLAAAESPDGDRLSDEEVRDQALTLLFAGHDTLTSTLALLLWELARNPIECERIEIEISGRQNGGGEPLPALRRCIEETMRLYPPAWIGPRRALEPVELAGVRVPAGASVNYSSLVTHRLPEIFERPDVFEPDRFLPERRAEIPPGGYIPFGAGPRICIGKRFALAEIEVVTTTVLRRLRPTLIDSAPLPLRPMPTLSPAAPVPVRFLPRR